MLKLLNIPLVLALSHLGPANALRYASLLKEGDEVMLSFKFSLLLVNESVCMSFRTLVRNVVASNSSFQGGLKFSYGIEMAENDSR